MRLLKITGLSLALFALILYCQPELTKVDAALNAHLRTQAQYPNTIRLVHEDVRKVRIVTTIRRDPFAYREDFIPPTGIGSMTRFSDGRYAWQLVNGKAVLLEGNPARTFLVRTFVEGRLYLDRERKSSRPTYRKRAPLKAIANLQKWSSATSIASVSSSCRLWGRPWWEAST